MSAGSIGDRLAELAGDVHLRATSSHITAALTAARGVWPIVKTPWFLQQHGRRAMAAQRLHDRLADVLAADQRERSDRDLPAELVGHRREDAGDRLPAARPRRRVGRMRVDDAAHIGQLPVDVAWRPVSEDGWCSPSTTCPSRSQTTMVSGVSSSYGTPHGLITNRSAPGTLAEMLPAVHTTSP